MSGCRLFIEGIHFLRDGDKYPLAFKVMNHLLINLLGKKIIIIIMQIFIFSKEGFPVGKERKGVNLIDVI